MLFFYRVAFKQVSDKLYFRKIVAQSVANKTLTPSQTQIHRPGFQRYSRTTLPKQPENIQAINQKTVLKQRGKTFTFRNRLVLSLTTGNQKPNQKVQNSRKKVQNC